MESNMAALGKIYPDYVVDAVNCTIVAYGFSELISWLLLKTQT